MNTDRGQSGDLYSISLSIVPCETLEETVEQALQAYAEELSCTETAVFEREGSTYSLCAAYAPDQSERSPLQSAALDRLADDEQTLPIAGRTDAGLYYYLLDLPAFGVLGLASSDPLDDELIEALAPLNEKFATVCRHQKRTTLEEGRQSDRTNQQSDRNEQYPGQRRTIEQFYAEIERILSAENRAEICRLAIAATDEITGSPNASIHLYDRTTEQLTPVAATVDSIDPFDELPAGYDDRETVFWEVYQSGEPAVIDDTSSFSGRVPRGERTGESAVILPLGEHGVLSIWAAEQDAFDESDLSMLRLFSRLVEVSLDRSERIERLEGVQEMTRSAVSGESHEEIAQEIIDQVPAMLDFPISTIWKYDTTAQALQPIASTHKATELFGEPPVFSSDESLAWRAFQSGETRTISDLESRSDVLNEDSPIGSEIIVPIGEFGIIVTSSTHAESFSASERRLVETLAANIESAMRLADRRQELDLLDQVLARILRHNIRNELNIIQGYASQLLETENRECVALAEQIIDRCSGLEMTAENAREMQEIVRSRDDRASIDLAGAIREAVSALRAEFPDATVTTVIDTEPTVVGHPALVAAIRHLAQNSIEHNDGSEHAVVELRLLERDGTPVIEVEDNGPGIPESEITILHKHGESALEHGSGAGLWLIDRVIDYSGGSLEFETSNDGTVVTITFQS